MIDTIVGYKFQLRLENFDNSKISFCLAEKRHKNLIKSWLSKPHVKKYWDNSSDSVNNINNYLQGTKDIFDYWVGYYQDIPYCLIMTSDANESTPEHFKDWIKLNQVNWSLDFMIGEKSFLGLGLSSITLKKFININNHVNMWLIDPAQLNYKAINSYKRVGFKVVSTFKPSNGYFKDIMHYLMILKK